MKYIVVKVWNDGSMDVVRPNQLLSIDEARSLAQMNKRLDPDHDYAIMQKID